MSATVLNAPATDQTARVCEPWCTSHSYDGSPDGGICFADDVFIDLGSYSTTYVVPRSARTDLSFSTSEGLSIGLSLNGYDGVEITPEQAQALAYALLAQVAQARGDKDLVEEFRAMAERHACTPAGAR